MIKIPEQIKDDEMSLLDILLFLKDSVRNVFISTIVCLLIGAAYFLAMPKVYVASATIEMAIVAGEMVEEPISLYEKIKLPLFFSATTLHACDSNEEHSKQDSFAEKLKPILNRATPLITFTFQAYSPEKAKTCLEAVIDDIKKYQNEKARPIIEREKQIIAEFKDQLKYELDLNKLYLPLKEDEINHNYNVKNLIAVLVNTKEINDLKQKINRYENNLKYPKTKDTTTVNSIYAPKVEVNKRPLLITLFFLIAGVVFGLLITITQKIIA